MTFQDLHPGEMFGELAAIDKQPRTASIVTVIETFAMRVRAEEFLNMLWAYRVVGERILQRLTHLTPCYRRRANRTSRTVPVPTGRR